MVSLASISFESIFREELIISISEFEFEIMNTVEMLKFSNTHSFDENLDEVIIIKALAEFYWLLISKTFPDTYKELSYK